LGNANIFEIVQIPGGDDAVTENGRSPRRGNVTDEPIAKPALMEPVYLFSMEVNDL
jgi:hypothetical protein